MRPVCVLALVVLAATPSAIAKPATTILPQTAGTISHFPVLDVTSVLAEDVLHSTCSQTTLTNLSYRRSFMEFSIPSFTKGVTRATLIITDSSGTTVFPPPPPDVHEVSFYAADLVIDVSDYVAPTTLVGTLETDAGEAELHEIAFDVTDIVQQFEGGNVGFRIKLQIDPAGPCPSSRGSEFGGIVHHSPRLVIRGK